jgi:hypothetical protein
MSERISITDFLHPVVRDRLRDILAQLPVFRVFESVRTPERQAWLYAQGRTRPGKQITKAEPWDSYHQYGLAADIVPFIDGKFTWEPPQAISQWDLLHDAAKKLGLEPLTWEKPHLQLAGLKIEDLRAGKYPPGGDQAWADWLEGAIARWEISGGEAPRPPSGFGRPEMSNVPPPVRRSLIL